MKKIKIHIKDLPTQYILVDDDDYDIANLFNWRLDKDGYVVCNMRVNDKYYGLKLHRLINNTLHGDFTDHVNHNLLDNRKSKLRSCNHNQNSMNMKSFKNSSSKYKGITWRVKKNKWEAAIRHNGKQIFLGLFHEETAAAQAYDIIARKLFGKFAYFNNI